MNTAQRSALIGTALAIALMGSASSASAQNLPQMAVSGSVCVGINPENQDRLVPSQYGVANAVDSNAHFDIAHVVCPLPNAKFGTAEPTSVQVVAYDRSNSWNVACTLRRLLIDGTDQMAPITLQTSGWQHSPAQVLTFSMPPFSSVIPSMYVLECQIPGRDTTAGDFSHIAGIRVGP
jgi:hypothetical protein